MKKIRVILLTVVVCASMVACASEEERMSGNVDDLKKQVVALEAEIADLEAQKSVLEKSVNDLKTESGIAKYVITLNIKQTHFTLDIGEHLKDSMNDISIQIPVDKEYYDSVEIGDTIDDSFRMGSFIFKGSFGNWKITVEDKEIL
jgi:hypothetical protein